MIVKCKEIVATGDFRSYKFIVAPTATGKKTLLRINDYFSMDSALSVCPLTYKMNYVNYSGTWVLEHGNSNTDP